MWSPTYTLLRKCQCHGGLAKEFMKQHPKYWNIMLCLIFNLQLSQKRSGTDEAEKWWDCILKCLQLCNMGTKCALFMYTIMNEVINSLFIFLLLLGSSDSLHYGNCSLISFNVIFYLTASHKTFIRFSEEFLPVLFHDYYLIILCFWFNLMLLHFNLKYIVCTQYIVCILFNRAAVSKDSSWHNVKLFPTFIFTFSQLNIGEKFHRHMIII